MNEAAVSSLQGSEGARAGLSLAVVNTLEGLAALELEWEELFGSSPSPTPFMSWEWSYHWCRNYRPGDSMHVVVLRDQEGGLCGIVPLMRVPASWGQLGLREVRFLSDYRSSCLGCTGFLLRPGWEPACLQALCAYLAEAPWWDRLRLSPIRADAANLWEFCRQAAAAQFRTEMRLHSWQRHAPLPKTFDAYLEQCSRNRRRRLRSSMRNLEKRHDFHLRTSHTENEARSVVAWLVARKRERMHAKRQWTWFDDPRYGSFLQDFTAAALHKGRGRLLSLQLDGQLAGCALLFVTANAATFYFDAFAPAYESEHIIDAITGFVLQACIDEGLDLLDFMWGEMPHHYAKEKASALTLHVYRPRPRSLLFEGLAHAVVPAWHGARAVMPHRVVGALSRFLKRESAGGAAAGGDGEL